MNGFLKAIRNSKLYTITFLSLMGILLLPISALAEKKEESKRMTSGDALNQVSKEVISEKTFSGGIVFLIAIAGAWTIGCIVFAAMRISGAQGNAQKRVEGIIGLVFAGLGAWVLYNSYTIYGWFMNI